ncbi:hypothetical protein GCM10007939_20460 [Amylibacter marinus]|uniref:Heparinase II/III-like C-terminal domain-containing protein n=1 Tax=Amylibacter marinus TaxID=1475483 RepID=A0ABQ5VWW0_9RHOB|nr:heparinase II/III family protein [Amylibacter marinus]GLQ35763.1 hypothetical protein GCM10007939_20460 [Amylibacter marinus]
MGLLGENIGNKIAARRSVFSRAASAFIVQPEPRSIGVPARGTQLMAGYFLFAGSIVEAPGKSIWDLSAPDVEFERALHGFGWMDHLAAEGSAHARRLTKEWLWRWIDLYGAGRGEGWTPQLAGRRVVRVINHALMLLAKEEADQQQKYYKMLGQQADFLARRWRAAPRGAARFEALTGLIYCGLALEAKERHLAGAVRGLAKECEIYIGIDGAIPSRNPEELMQIFTSLAWAAHGINEAGKKPERMHLLAMERIVPVLRALRLGDGGLGHFHGGGRGMEGRLDQSLADAEIRLPALDKNAMGYQRMRHGKSTLLMDTGPQTIGRDQSFSALAFEMSWGRQPLIVNVGPGEIFGEVPGILSRSVAAHSTLCVANHNPERTDAKRPVVQEPLYERSENADFEMIAASHGGFEDSHGLRHYRSLELARDGMFLRGKDSVVAEGRAHQQAYLRWLQARGAKSIPFAIRFHLHPRVRAELGMKDTAVTITLPSGELWVLRANGAKIAIEPSQYMRYGRLNPSNSKQVVVSGKAIDYEGGIEWSLIRLDE